MTPTEGNGPGKTWVDGCGKAGRVGWGGFHFGNDVEAFVLVVLDVDVGMTGFIFFSFWLIVKVFLILI